MAKALWTDGSVADGAGGWAVILERPNGAWEPVSVGRDMSPEVTNVRMEARAIIEAIKYAGEEGGVVYTDSKYWVDLLYEWGPIWSRYNWKKADGAIRNVDLAQQMFAFYRKYPVEVRWVKAHSGEGLNEIADEWARIAREEDETREPGEGDVVIDATGGDGRGVDGRVLNGDIVDGDVNRGWLWRVVRQVGGFLRRVMRRVTMIFRGRG